MLTRRAFGLISAAAAASGLSGAARAAPRPLLTTSTFAGVSIGCNTFTFGALPAGDAIRGIAEVGFGSAELHPRQIEPVLGGLPPQRGAPPDPAQQAVNQYARENLRRWRLTVPLDVYADVGRAFRDAGVAMRVHNVNYRDDFTDEEIDRTFEMTKALGAELISAVGSNALMRRLDPFARRHQLKVGFHNEVNIPNIAAFEAVREGLSDYCGFTLDIGHFTATGGDVLGMLAKHRDRIFCLHIKDRKKNQGPTVMFGQGDTPIVPVLRWLRDNRFNPPTNIEQETPGWDRLAIARQAFDYCRAALTS